MDTSKRMQWLRRVLLFKVIVTFLAWGLPSLIGPPAFLALFNIEMPQDPIFLRLFGAVVSAFGVAYWFAYRDPLKNAAIVRVGVVDNGLVTLTLIGVGLTTGISSWFMWGSAVLTAFFCIAFFVLAPQKSSAT